MPRRIARREALVPTQTAVGPSSRNAIKLRPLGLRSTSWVPGKFAGPLLSTLSGQPNRPEM